MGNWPIACFCYPWKIATTYLSIRFFGSTTVSSFSPDKDLHVYLYAWYLMANTLISLILLIQLVAYYKYFFEWTALQFPLLSDQLIIQFVIKNQRNELL